MIFFVVFNKTNPHREGQPAHQQCEVKDSVPPQRPCRTLERVPAVLEMKFSFVLFIFFMSVSECFSTVASSTRFNEGMLSHCFCSWKPGSPDAAFVCWMSVWFPVVCTVSVTETSKRQTGLNFLKPLPQQGTTTSGRCCHLCVRKLISQMRRTCLCPPRCQSPRYSRLD